MKEVSPTKVGVFILVALILGTASLIFVGSVNLFSNSVRMVLYFDESVNGLSIGAPIKYRGVSIGKVVDIRTRYNQPNTSSAIPVFVDIELNRLELELGNFTEESSGEEFATRVWSGLRGKLELDSLITGQLYIELDYADASQWTTPRFVQQEWIFPEIPTEPSTMATLGTGTSDILAKITAIPFDEIGIGMARLINLLEKRLNEVDLVSLEEQVLLALQEVREVLGDEELRRLPVTLSDTLEVLQSTGTGIRKDLKEVTGSVTRLEEDLRTTLRRIDSLTGQLEVSFHPGSPTRLRLDAALDDFQMLSLQLSELLSFIERNPSALLRGRAKPTD